MVIEIVRVDDDDGGGGGHYYHYPPHLPILLSPLFLSIYRSKFHLSFLLLLLEFARCWFVVEVVSILWSSFDEAMLTLYKIISLC